MGIITKLLAYLKFLIHEKDNKIAFAIKKRGEREVFIKTVKEISKEREIIRNLNPIDAETIGYAAASENLHEEKKFKNHILKDFMKSEQN